MVADNRTVGAGSRHIIAPVSLSRPSH